MFGLVCYFKICFIFGFFAAFCSFCSSMCSSFLQLCLPSVSVSFSHSSLPCEILGWHGVNCFILGLPSAQSQRQTRPTIPNNVRMASNKDWENQVCAEPTQESTLQIPHNNFGGSCQGPTEGGIRTHTVKEPQPRKRKNKDSHLRLL